jgi:hypothetical protein
VIFSHVLYQLSYLGALRAVETQRLIGVPDAPCPAPGAFRGIAGPGGAPEEARENAKRLLTEGTDPTLEKKRRKPEHTEAVTFRAIADECVTKLKREGRADATIAKTEWLLAFADANLGSMPMRSIDAPTVLKAPRAVEIRGRYESARRLRTTIGSVFRYAIATTRADSDPTYALRGALIHVKATPRAAITELDTPETRPPRTAFGRLPQRSSMSPAGGIHRRQLGHVEGNDVRSAYPRGKHCGCGLLPDSWTPTKGVS